MRQVGIKAFQHNMFSVLRGKLPLIITRHRQSRYLITEVKTTKYLTHDTNCELCHRREARDTFGVAKDYNLAVMYLCNNCIINLKKKGFEII
jgi:polysaccharide pyruvyl transferase WcaK-like protein